MFNNFAVKWSKEATGNDLDCHYVVTTFSHIIFSAILTNSNINSWSSPTNQYNVFTNCRQLMVANDDDCMKSTNCLLPYCSAMTHGPCMVHFIVLYRNITSGIWYIYDNYMTSLLVTCTVHPRYFFLKEFIKIYICACWLQSFCNLNVIRETHY